MRVRIVTKGYGVILTAQEPFNQELFDSWSREWEEIGDSPDCVSIIDDKGNRVILNKDIVKESIFIVEK